MPLDAIIRARDRYLARALAEDRAVAERLAVAYRGTLGRLQDALNRVHRDLRELADAGSLTPVSVERLGSYQDLLALLRIELGQFSLEAGRLAQQALPLQAEIAIEGQREMIEAQGPGLGAAFAQPDLRALAELDRILVRAQQEGGALADLGGQTAAQVGEDVLTMIGTGQSPAFIARYLRGMVGLPFGQMANFVRTASAYASSEASAAAQVANRRLLRGWMWSSAKDRRVCAACLARDGEIFPVGEVLNDHHSGRCSAIPVTHGDDWTASYQRGRDWYAEQSRADQALLVGKGTRDLLAAGGTSWEAIPADYHNATMGLMSRREPLYRLRELGPMTTFHTTPRLASGE